MTTSKRPKSARIRRATGQVDALRKELRAARKRIAELEKRADTDDLLGILNRRGFARDLTRAIAYAKRYGASAALIYLDVNGLKPVNDRHGHAAGDALLKAIAKTLVRNVRGSDTVARLGGDEFGILLWNLSEAHARAKASVLEAAVARTRVTVAGKRLAVSIAAGCARLQAKDNAAAILARADKAMYARKRAQRALRQ